MIVHWIWLAARPHISDRVKVELVRAFEDPEGVFFADGEAYRQVAGLSEEGMEALKDKNLKPAEKILDDCDRENLHILTYQDAAYPSALKNISEETMVF